VDTGENPAHPFEDGLAVHVFRNFFELMITVAITFDGEASPLAFDDKIDSERADPPLRRHGITCCQETLHDFALEGGLRAIFLFFERAHKTGRVLGVLD
jgi:hypothetical protein